MGGPSAADAATRVHRRWRIEDGKFEDEDEDEKIAGGEDFKG
jgi:hypothetical protein